nr:MAG TPA: hypothetical protein [Bacteriophage sp.]
MRHFCDKPGRQTGGSAPLSHVAKFAKIRYYLP